MVTVIDQHHQPPSDGSLTHRPGGGGGGGAGVGGAGGAGGHRLLVPVVLEALPDSCLGVARKLDLGAVALYSSTSSSFEVKNLSAGPAPLRCAGCAVVPKTSLCGSGGGGGGGVLSRPRWWCRRCLLSWYRLVLVCGPVVFG